MDKRFLLAFARLNKKVEELNEKQDENKEKLTKEIIPRLYEEIEKIEKQEGPQGLPGVDGKPGRDGVDGKDGTNGKDGVDGKPGRDGIDGKPGRDGKDGIDGKPGRDGVDGKTPSFRVGKVETIEPGEEASVVLRKKEDAYLVDFYIPQGYRGPMGIDAKINGKTTLDIVAGENINIKQEDKKLLISSDVKTPTKTSELENDSEYITNDIETDFNIDGKLYLNTVKSGVSDAAASRIVFGTPSKIYSYLSSNNAGAFAFSKGNGNITLYPNTGTYNCLMTDCNSDLGRSDRKWKDLYLSGNLKDGTNTIPISKIATTDYVDEKGFLTLETLPKWDGGNE